MKYLQISLVSCVSIYNPISSLIFGLSRVFSNDANTAILVSQNNEMTAMLALQTNLVGLELFSYVNEKFDDYLGENTL